MPYIRINPINPNNLNKLFHPLSNLTFYTTWNTPPKKSIPSLTSPTRTSPTPTCPTSPTTTSLSASTPRSGPSSLPPSVLSLLSKPSYDKPINTTKTPSSSNSYPNSIKISYSKSITSEATTPSKPSHFSPNSSPTKTSIKSAPKSSASLSTPSSSNQSTKKPSSKIKPSKPSPKSTPFQIPM